METWEYFSDLQVRQTVPTVVLCRSLLSWSRFQLPCSHAVGTGVLRGKWSVDPRLARVHHLSSYPTAKWQYLPASTYNLPWTPHAVRGKLAEITAAYGSKTIIGSITAEGA